MRIKFKVKKETVVGRRVGQKKIIPLYIYAFYGEGSLNSKCCEMLCEAFLVLFDLISMASCCHGIYINCRTCNSVVCFLFGGIGWFTLSGLGSLAGILDIIMNSWSSDVSLPRKNIYLQFHYFLAWIALITGYPLFVTAIWLTYCPSFTVHLHLLCVALPLLVWSFKATSMKFPRICSDNFILTS
ncbi:unnamed protein product [Allacma fusca]|uniref:Uncharacterized protein n=1 Tax=Allacma fusca TaxID=39272 RepID=A0A8J2L3G3_9HEXA|nr:unnamed protein product [Allacma fusca]